MLLTDIKMEYKKLLLEKGITQKEAAKAAGINPSYIPQILGRNPVNKTLIKLLDAIGCDVEIKIIDRKAKEKTRSTDGDFFIKLHNIEREAIAKYYPDELEEYDREWEEKNK